VVGKLVNASQVELEAIVEDIGINMDDWLERLEVSDLISWGPVAVTGGIQVFTSDPTEPRRGVIDGVTFWVGHGEQMAGPQPGVFQGDD